MAGGTWERVLAAWAALYAIPALDDMADDRDALVADVALYMAERDEARADAQNWRSIAAAHAARAERLEAQLAELTAPHNGHRPEVRTLRETKREMVP